MQEALLIIDVQNDYFPGANCPKDFYCVFGGGFCQCCLEAETVND